MLYFLLLIGIDNIFFNIFFRTIFAVFIIEIFKY